MHQRATNILTKLKYKNSRVKTQNSLHRVIAAAGSSRIWVQKGVDEVVTCPARRDVSLSIARHIN
jgi:protein-L-isoaspartate O-methyltransferase